MSTGTGTDDTDGTDIEPVVTISDVVQGGPGVLKRSRKLFGQQPVREYEGVQPDAGEPASVALPLMRRKFPIPAAGEDENGWPGTGETVVGRINRDAF